MIRASESRKANDLSADGKKRNSKKARQSQTSLTLTIDNR